MSDAIICATRADAQAIAARVDAARGLPRCNCDRHGGTGGGGDYCTCPEGGVDLACPCVTRTSGEPIAHPSGAAWAYPVDDSNRDALTLAERTACIALTSDWCRDCKPETKCDGCGAKTQTETAPTTTKRTR